MNRAAALASVSAAALALAAPLAAAHPPDEHGRHPPSANDTAHAHAAMRLWTNTRTGETVRGAFLASREGRVSIERENGDVVVFALDELTPADQTEVRTQAARVRELNSAASPALAAARPTLASAAPAAQAPAAAPPAPAQPAGDAPAKPAQAGVFDRFTPFVRTRWDDAWLYVESDGLPHAPGAHQLMVGITSWQQQVPLPQRYTGDNAWRIPLKPELADKPISGKNQLFRGAIALAANGVPIFNALNNRGEDALKAGELDEFGGHCGRADDYHYHVAPLSLQKAVGPGQPIAYALDGFPLFGLFDPAAKKGQEKACPLGGTAPLDEFNGHFGAPASPGQAQGLYHYHASTTYPYINGGVRGKVTVKDDQIDPQPRARPVRDWLQPLRGAKITGFKTVAENAWSLEYTLAGAKHLVNYRLEPNGAAVFDFVDPAGTTRTERYEPRPDRDRPPRNNADQGDRPRRRNRDGGGGGGGGDDRPPPPPPPPGEPRDGPGPQRGPGGGKGNEVHPDSKVGSTGLKLSSPVVGADSRLPAEFTCDGAGISPPLRWASPPAGTQSFAITMHHIPGPPRPGDRPGEDKHVYLVAYNIPASTLALEKGKPRPGVLGLNTVNRRAEYAPPCSQGPGAKLYTITVYALSLAPTLKPERERSAAGPTMDSLLAAIKDHTLDSATLDVVYERPNQK